MEQYIDHHSFLVEHNLFTEEMKDNVAMAGYCVVEGVKDVATAIDFNTNTVKYYLLLPGKLYNNLKLLERFESGKDIGLWGAIKLKMFLRKKRKIETTDGVGIVGYKLDKIANDFLKNYLNDKWRASVEIFNADDKDESKDFRIRGAGDQPIN